MERELLGVASIVQARAQARSPEAIPAALADRLKRHSYSSPRFWASFLWPETNNWSPLKIPGPVSAGLSAIKWRIILLGMALESPPAPPAQIT